MKCGRFIHIQRCSITFSKNARINGPIRSAIQYLVGHPTLTLSFASDDGPSTDICSFWLYLLSTELWLRMLRHTRHILRSTPQTWFSALHTGAKHTSRIDLTSLPVNDAYDKPFRALSILRLHITDWYYQHFPYVTSLDFVIHWILRVYLLLQSPMPRLLPLKRYIFLSMKMLEEYR